MAIRELEASLERMKGEMEKVAEISNVLDGTAQSLQTAATTLTAASLGISTVASSMPRLDQKVGEMASTCQNLNATLQGVRQDLQSSQRTMDEINKGTNALLKLAEDQAKQLKLNQTIVLVVGALVIVLIALSLAR